jgi:XTP/dITP diphosphohydrolase
MAVAGLQTRLLGGRVVLASGNPGKLRELAALVGARGLEVVPQSEFEVAPVEETGITFLENALLKARAAAAASGLAAIADDSGVVVPALGGAPGVRSARYAGEAADDADNRSALLAAMEGLVGEDRRAAFVALVVLLRHPEDPDPLVARGRWGGVILEAPRGAGGFGYDSLFGLPDLGRSAAELTPEEKNARSHRGRALAALLAALAEEEG